MQPWVSEGELVAALRNLLVPRPPAQTYASAEAVLVDPLVAGVSAPLQLVRPRPGWWVISTRDAFVTLSQADARPGLAEALVRTWRLGPASRVAVFVQENTRLTYTCTAILSTTTADATTGLVSTATAVPQLRAWWSGLERPPTDTRAGILAAATGTLAAQLAVNATGPVYLQAYPPGWARRCHVVAASSVVCSIVDGPTGTVEGELPASRDHVLHAVDPWACVQVSVTAGSTSAWLSWSDR